VLVIDMVGTVRYANSLILELLGWTQHDYVGRSLIEMVVPEDLTFAAEIIDEGPEYFGTVLGPMRIRYQDDSGLRRKTDFWARQLEDRSGYIMVVPPESTSDALAEAVEAIANGNPLYETADHIVASFGGYPINGFGCLLRVIDGSFEPMTAWPLPRFRPGAVGAATPWGRSARTGNMVESTDENHELTAALHAAGFTAAWSHPVIDRHGNTIAAMVAFGDFSRQPSPNQRLRLREIVAVAALAFNQHELRGALERAAFSDPLTGVASRMRLEQEITDGIADAVVLYLDLDGFKQVNDRHGHVIGDQVLIEAAIRIGQNVRSEDLIVRMGGDEFVVVLRSMAEHLVDKIVDRLVADLAFPYAVTAPDGDIEVTVDTSATVGVCMKTEMMTFDQALRAADRALNSAKRAGKQQWQYAETGPSPSN